MFFSNPVSALPEQSLVPGGIALLELPGYQQKTVVRFNGKRVAVYPQNDTWIAMAGIPLNTKPGEYHFSIEGYPGTIPETGFNVSAKKYQEQHLTIKNKRKVNPNEKDLKRISQERSRKRKAKMLRTETSPDVDFIWPVSGRSSSIFGLRRFFNESHTLPFIFSGLFFK